jgi:general secretion pathway protein E
MNSNMESGLVAEEQVIGAGHSEKRAYMPTLPFAFARRFGVVLDSQPNANGAYEVAAKSQPRLSTLAEIRRIAKHPTIIRIVAADEFDQLLSAAYSQDSNEAKQMVEDLGGEMDLASLASALPKTEDL